VSRSNEHLVSLVKNSVKPGEATTPVISTNVVSNLGEDLSSRLEQRYLGYALDICFEDGGCQYNFKGAPDSCYSVSSGVYTMRFTGDMVCELYSSAFCTDQSPKIIDKTTENIPAAFNGFNMESFSCRRFD
jgi:hypothetical protein